MAFTPPGTTHRSAIAPWTWLRLPKQSMTDGADRMRQQSGWCTHA